MTWRPFSCFVVAVSGLPVAKIGCRLGMTNRGGAIVATADLLLGGFEMLKTQMPIAERARLIDVQAVAEMLGVSTRHIYRLADGGRMPRPMKLGGACRWDRQAITDWIDGGCKPVATRKRGT